MFGLSGPPDPGHHIRPSAPGPHKSFIKFNLLLVKAQWLWSCARGLLSMVYRLFKPCLLIDVLCLCFKETTPLYNVHLSCFVDFILCPTDKYMFKVNNKKIRLICWICSKLKVSTAWPRLCVFIVDLDHSQHINIVFLLLTLKKHLSAVQERQVITFWKNKKRDICIVIKIARPISFNDYRCTELKLAMNIWQYFSSKFALRIPSVLSSRPVIWSAVSSPT